MPTFFSDTWAEQLFNDSGMKDYFGKVYSNYARSPEEEPEPQTFKRNPEPRKGFIDARNDIVPCVTSLGPSEPPIKLFHDDDKFDALKYGLYGLYTASIINSNSIVRLEIS